jgi:hypothetical protein
MALGLLSQEKPPHLMNDYYSAPTINSSALAKNSLPWPETAVEPVRIRWRYAIGIPLVHLLACSALVPWLFSWTGVACAFIGLYVFGTLGINLCSPPIDAPWLGSAQMAGAWPSDSRCVYVARHAGMLDRHAPYSSPAFGRTARSTQSACKFFVGPLWLVDIRESQLSERKLLPAL